MAALTMNDIGAKLKVAREAVRLSQEEVALHMGLPRPAISLVESGQRSVSSIELARFAELYRRPVSFFVQVERELSTTEEALNVLLRAEAEQGAFGINRVLDP